ncbi:MAG: DUF1330 domain-containing protein [Gammaproteobacteria bacterium]|nr:DUF1330 domain-containing protein [Gammaproteobacteria bacterium]MBU1645745.1 DUF1330 domain-containing protein [Gammaproteobacteria bacterium]MBU1971253.1 DUF1330 domain-containing protein [Gammaproteobacteria bacterium]
MTKPAYLVVDAKSSDPERMAEYRRLSTLAVEKFGGRFIVRGGAYEVLEGGWQPQRLVVVELPDMATARAFYDSPEYVAAREARAGVSSFDMVLVEGY